jgi:hypothetical protein
MAIFYIFAVVFAFIGLLLWWKNPNITHQEYLIGSVVAFGLAVMFNIIAVANIHSQTSDFETRSGRVTQVEHWPSFVERWIETHTERYACGRDSKGNTTYCTRTYTTTEYDTHPERWYANRNFGKYDDSDGISEQLYNEIKIHFGEKVVNGGKQSYDHNGNLNSGDDTRYVTANDTGFIYPATITTSFENKIKASPNIFQFTKVPTNLNSRLFDWPTNPEWTHSDRLMGTARVINQFKFDQMNSRLGPIKRVNVIIIGFGNLDPIYGQYQQAKWIGGKKNDLVLTYTGGYSNTPAKTAFVFGWTESEMVKRNLSTILLKNPINDSILPLIEQEINKNYQIKDWSKFNYLTIYPKTWVYYVYFILICVSQIGIYLYFHNNWDRKNRWEHRRFYK